MLDSSDLKYLAESVRRAAATVPTGQAVPGQPAAPAAGGAEPGRFWHQAGAAGWTDGALPPTAVCTVARELGAAGIFGLYADTMALSMVLADSTGWEGVSDKFADGAAQVAFVSTVSTADGPRRLTRPAFPAPARRYGAVLGSDRIELVAVAVDRPVGTSAADPAYLVTDEVVASVVVSSRRITELRLLRDLIACAQIAGAHRYLLGLTSDFGQTRVQFGKPIAAFQGLQHVLVDVFAWLEAADLVLAQTFSVAEQQGALPERGRAAVAFVRAKASWALQRAYEVLGGVGFMTEHPLNHYTREMLVLLASLGDADTHYEQQADLVGRVPGGQLPSRPVAGDAVRKCRCGPAR